MIFLMLWIIAGCLIGWLGNDLIFGAAKVNTPISYNFVCAFIGGMVAYTILL